MRHGRVLCVRLACITIPSYNTLRAVSGHVRVAHVCARPHNHITAVRTASSDDLFNVGLHRGSRNTSPNAFCVLCTTDVRIPRMQHIIRLHAFYSAYNVIPIILLVVPCFSGTRFRAIVSFGSATSDIR